MLSSCSMNLIIRVISFNCSSQESEFRGFRIFVSTESEKSLCWCSMEVINFQCCGNPQINIFLSHLGTDTGVSGLC